MRLEEIVAKVLGQHAPVVAIGNPREWFPKLGAHRLYVSDKDWRHRFARLAAEAELIVLVASSAAWLAWELEWIKAHNHSHKLIIVLPPARHGSGQLVETVDMLVRIGLRREDVAGLKDCRVAFLGHGGSLRFVRCEKMGDIAYELALYEVMRRKLSASHASRHAAMPGHRHRPA